MRALWAGFIVLFAACATTDDTPPGAGAEIYEGEPVLGEDDGGKGDVLSLAPDPSTASDGGWCWQPATVHDINLRTYYPSNGGCSASKFSPLVIVLPGYGKSYLDYHSLLRHLAKNGYIGVSMQVVPDFKTLASYQAAADEAWSVITDYVWTTWSKRFYIDPSNVGLIGHSRGGEVVRHLAESLVGDPIFTVRAVVPMGPAYHNAVQLDGQNTVAALVIVGSADNDTKASSAYEIHDRAGSDASQRDPGINANAIYRSMKLLHGGDHGGFSTNDSDQAKVTQGYVLAFLHAHLKLDMTYFEDYIRGDHIPHGWAAGVTSQYSDGFYRRVIDNFDDGLIAFPTLGGSLTVDAGSGSITNLATSTSSPHATQAFRFTPQANNAGFQWSIPAGKRDVTSFKYLSLRIGQATGASTDDVLVRIVNSGKASRWLRVTSYTLGGALPQPVPMHEELPPPYPDAHMGTIRIPLGAFGDHDNVTSVEFKAQSEAAKGEYILDNVEFSEWILKP